MIDTLKQHKRLKQIFARQLGVTEKTIQKCAEELIYISTSKGGTFTATDVIEYAENSSTSLYKLFDWESTEEERISIANAFLTQATILIGSDNIIYTLQ